MIFIADIGELYHQGGTHYEIPYGYTEIGEKAFNSCRHLTTSVTIPESITKIDKSAFWDCDRLEKIEIPASVKIIGKAAFKYCRSLQDVSL
ncbi:MAG: leucine-rich repeat domain-containing protein, partial [Thermoguttaceae bacterium]|nr:leucine-rich repeat domain-containing protein [Thermoguttaceae bacterium]